MIGGPVTDAEQAMINEAIRIYSDDGGMSFSHIARVLPEHFKMWRAGESSRDPVEFARHFVSLRVPLPGLWPPRGERTQASYTRSDPIALPPVNDGNRGSTNNPRSDT